MRRLEWALAGSLLVLAGCAHRPETGGAATPGAGAPAGDTSANGPSVAEIKPTRWGRALDQWTRTEKVYHQFETRLLVTATYRSEVFREAYVEEYGRRYRLSDAEKEKMARREHDAGSSYHEFFVAAYTGTSRENDFQKRNSLWRLRLTDDKGNSVDPLVINRQKDDDPALHAFFPFFSEWAKAYVVKFPRAGLAEDSKTLTFTLSSAIGDAALSYDRTHADTPSPGVHVELPTAVSAASPEASPTPTP